MHLLPPMVEHRVPVELRRSMAALRSSRPPFPDEATWVVRPSRTFVVEESRIRSAELHLVWFKTRGCTYDRAGECTMCNYGGGPEVASDLMVAHVEEALASEAAFDALYVSPAGSMFDPTEVPPAALAGIRTAIAAASSNSLSCENRPEHVTEAVVAAWASSFTDRSLAVNLGIESSSAFIRTQLLGKSMTDAQIISAIETLNRHGVKPIANVLIGAPGLTPREAFEDAVRSGRWALDHGARLVVLFPSNGKNWTIFEPLVQMGLWSPPSLWALVDAIWLVSDGVPGRVGLSWFDAPLSEVVIDRPTTCSECRPSVVRGLHEYRESGDLHTIHRLRTDTCDCRDRWLRSLDGEAQTDPLELRARQVQASIARARPSS
jgi:radical SAM enzyme (TIGR01210 family)